MSRDKDITYRTKIQRAIRENRQSQLVLTQTDLPYANYTIEGNIANAKPQGRLTLESGVPVPITDQNNKTTIYWTPFEGAQVPVYDSTVIGSFSFSELTLPLDDNPVHPGFHDANKNFDCFVFFLDGVLTLGTGPAWTSSHVRGSGAGTTELAVLNGIYVNANDIQLRYGNALAEIETVTTLQATYVGTFRTVTIDGTTADSAKFRLVYNAYNRVSRNLRMAEEITNSWTYSTDAWRIANGDAANCVFVLQGLQNDMVMLKAVHAVKNSTSTSRNVGTGIGLDFVDSNIAFITSPADCTDAQRSLLIAEYAGYPELGLSVLTWLEFGNLNDTQTWYGDGGLSNGILQTGLFGWGMF